MVPVASRPDFCASGNGTTISDPDFGASGSGTASSGQGTLGQPSSSSPRLCSCDWLSTTLVARGDALAVDAVWLRTNTMPHTTSIEMQIGTNQQYHHDPFVCSRPVVRPLYERRYPITSPAMPPLLHTH